MVCGRMVGGVNGQHKHKEKIGFRPSSMQVGGKSRRSVMLKS